jgi:hypothetical protein
MTYNYTLLTQNIYDGGNPVHGLGQVQISGGLNRLMGSQPSSLHNWISNDNIYEQAIKKTCTDSLTLKKTTFSHNNERHDKHA